MTMSQLMKVERHAEEVPPLYNGDRLTQPEFHRRYLAMPEGVKAELIGGIVYMASPVGKYHARFHLELGTALNFYKAFTPGLDAADNLTAILDDGSEPQPDLILRVASEFGGQSYYTEKAYLKGAPELVAEIAHSSESIDLGAKRLDYLRTGVGEYVVYCTHDHTIHWFHFPSRRKLKADKHGVWRSKVFPGLWIDAPALAARDTAKLIATVQAGLATQEHAAFVAELARRKGRR